MSIRLSIFLIGVVCAALAIAITLFVTLPRRLNGEKFIAKWRELQLYCRDKTTWSLAVIEADKLLDLALKKRKLKGKTMGERLVAAQRILSDNDDVWFAHNLAKKLLAQTDIKPKEDEVKEALIGFRQALRDIGALPGESQELRVKRQE